MKIRSILLLSVLALSMTMVSCNTKPNSEQDGSRQLQNEQVVSRMNHDQRGSHQSGRMNKAVKGRNNQERNNFAMNILTKEQKESFKTIRTNCMKELLPLKDQLKELKLHERTLMDADQPDINAINTNIDKMSAVQNKMAKISAKMKIEMSAQLTSEQKIRMKSHQGEKGRMGQSNKYGKNHPQRPNKK